jgi:1-acyl-sn-glycerol-3-phosphate acyltransferase
MRGARQLLAWITAGAVMLAVRLLTAVRDDWVGCEPSSVRRIYFANHRSHADFVLIWTTLPPLVRARSRPVAAADYWLKGWLRTFVIKDVFRGVLVERNCAQTRRQRETPVECEGRQQEPVDCMRQAVEEGASLIFFPEGTRNCTDELVLPFKSGIYHLARALPDIELVPVWIDNLNRVLPKGAVLPVPFLCTVTFGAPIALYSAESKADFLGKARAALLALAPAPSPLRVTDA